MRRLFIIVLLLLAATGTQAQPTTPQPGDPPVLARIMISPSGEDGTVTIIGQAGAIYAGAYLTVRNLYTGATAYSRAGVTGSFNVQIAGSDNTPFWISPSNERIPPDEQNTSGSLPGGPGVIVYSLSHNAPLPSNAITKIAVDGSLTDWSAYPDALRFDAKTRAVYALRNNDSLYLAFSGTYVNTSYAKLQIRFTIDINSYTLTFDPRQAVPAELIRTNPVTHELDAVVIAARQGSAIEARIPLSFAGKISRFSLDSVHWLDANGAEISADTIGKAIAQRDESDGIFRATSLIGPSPTRFSLAGSTGQNGAVWSAEGNADNLQLKPGANWNVQMDVDFGAANLPVDDQMVGRISLQPIARMNDGKMQLVGGVSTNNGWSGILTAGGLPIDNLESAVLLGEGTAEPSQMIRGTSDSRFPLDFALTLPSDLPPGLYVPFFAGYIQAANGTRIPWNPNSAIPTRLPLVLNVGAVDNVHLLWTLFADDPSNGNRGVLPAEDQGYAALSNRVRFNSQTYILPPFQPDTRDPISYSLEPYLLNELPNSYSGTGAPLIPFLFPGGTIQARITRPDGTVDDLGSTEIVQNQLSTAEQDERTLFGAQSPLDEFRLTTLNPKFSAYQFRQYGQYQITLIGSLQDLWGNHYLGGGTYTVVAAELLDLTPGVLPGTPFEVGDALNFGLHLSPGVPADVAVKVRVYPLDGSPMITQTMSGKANASGYFQPSGTPFIFTNPGEYVIDYDARYTDSDQRLWQASTRSAGVIAAKNSSIIAHGERGLPGVVSDIRPAWFSVPQYAQATPISGAQTALYFPYHSGDVAWIDDGSDSSIQPVIRAQDLDGDYAKWLTQTLQNVPGSSLPTSQLANEGELPIPLVGQDNSASLHPDQIASDSYTYVSAVRPNVTVRQFVAGGDEGGLTLGWDQDDPLNRQIGAGLNGNRPGDFIFLFGGAVIREAKVRNTAIYGALAVVTDGDTPRIYPPDRGAAGGADGGPLLTINGQPVDTFIDLTGVQPGERLTVGDQVAVAGQVAPTLASTVTTTFTKPSGKVIQFTGRANAVGAYYDPATQFTVDEPGVWNVEVQITQDGVTSSGQIQSPMPQGGVLGAHDNHFSIYVVPQGVDSLPWNPLVTDTIIPIVSPYNFSFTVPADWTHTQAYYTLTTPGYIIEDGTLHVSGRSFSYSYNAPLQSRAFSNLENNGQSGTYISDVRTLTFVATGIDASGTTQIRSRTFTLMHDRLITAG